LRAWSATNPPLRPKLRLFTRCLKRSQTHPDAPQRAVDVVWATLAWRLGGEAGKLRSWIQINLTTLAILGLGLLSSIWVDYADESWTTAIVLVAFLRSGVDYWRNWDFYGGQAATAA
jgi:hypothetical protein